MIINTIFTHGAIFHADDAMAVAMLKYLYPNAKVERVFKLLECGLKDDEIAVDVGLGEFDHHQSNCAVMSDGIKHCACTLVWDTFAHDIISSIAARNNISITLESEEIAKKIVLKDILHGIAVRDNNGNDVEKGLLTISSIVASMNNAWCEHEDSNKLFMNAVDFCQKQLFRKIQICLLNNSEDVLQTCVTAEEKAIGHIASIDHYVPYSGHLDYSKIWYVICPSNRTGINVFALKPNGGFPISWLGLGEDTAGKVQKGMRFCHNGNFIAVFDTYEDAFNGAQAAENYQNSCKKNLI